MKLKLLVYTACTLNTLFSHVFSTRSGAFPDFFANCRCGVSPCLRPLPTGSIPKTNLPIGAQVEPRKTCRTDESFYSFYHHFDSFSWIKKLFQEFLEIRSEWGFTRDHIGTRCQLELPDTSRDGQVRPNQQYFSTAGPRCAINATTFLKQCHPKEKYVQSYKFKDRLIMCFFSMFLTLRLHQAIFWVPINKHTICYAHQGMS